MPVRPVVLPDPAAEARRPLTSAAALNPERPADALWLPAEPLRVQLQGLAALGLNAEALGQALGPWPASAASAGEPGECVPASLYLRLWALAQAAWGRPGLPTALAEVIPFGAFGMLDYLVGSASTLAACCHSAVLHFRMVASDVWLELSQDEATGWHLLQVCGAADVPPEAAEFTLANVVQRLRCVGEASFMPVRAWLPVPRPDTPDSLRERFYGPGLCWGARRAVLALAPEGWQRPLRRADPYLHSTLQQVAQRLQLGRPGGSALEAALRSRLRVLLPVGQATPAQVAPLLGWSERTLHRRLAAEGVSFKRVLQQLREEEALRLVADPGCALAEVAARLGYAEQTSFTRVFRQWTGLTPGAWRRQQGGGAKRAQTRAG